MNPMRTTEHTVRLNVRDAEERIIEGVIVPYGDVIETSQGRERFVPGAFDDTTPGDVVLKVEHEGVPIGKAIDLTDTPAGAMAAFRVSRTVRGDEVLTLAADGVYTGLSVGFIPRHSKLVDGDVVEHRRVDLVETSITHRPAYESAQVTSVRSQEDHMSETTTPAVTIADVADAIETVLDERTADTDTRLRTLEAARAEPAAEIRKVTPLDWFNAEIRALQGDDTEKRVLADMTGTTGGTGDASGIVPDSYWAAGLVSVLDARRPTFANSGRMPYPSSGTQVTLPVVTTQPTVGDHAQKAEAESTAMVIGQSSFPIQFGAGAQNVALELVAQSNPPAMTVLFNSLLRAYSAWTEDKSIVAIEAAATATGGLLPTTDYSGLVRALTETSVSIYDATGDIGNLVGLPTAEWIDVLSLTDAFDRRVLSILGPTNADGQASLVTESTGLAGLTLFHAPKLAAPVQYNASAYQTADSGPIRLQQTNVSQIGVDVAVYGGVITAAVIPAGIYAYTV